LAIPYARANNKKMATTVPASTTGGSFQMEVVMEVAFQGDRRRTRTRIRLGHIDD